MDTETRLRDASAPNGPDIMNDPRFATNVGGDDVNGEQDTCRICRGEATKTEPLFYPCKCSGSIKFVHQDCLMEWLSHSQKKHCELCKTPFRFTKLYSPDMPPTLPIHVFLQHIVLHALQNVATWLRFCLVIVVWVGILPWMMRHIWGFLFWFADGGWALKNIESVNARPMSDPNTLMLGATISMMAVNGTSPASPLLAQPTTSSMWSTLAKLVQSLAVFGPFSQTLNMSDLSPYIGGYMTLIEENVSNNTNRTSTLLNSAAPIRPTRTSILSEIQWLKTLTHNERVNGLIITCLEGQIITILVVICFILIFLIREWVVQQQPGINMGAGFNAEFAGADRAARVVNPIPENEPEAEEPDRVVEDAEAFQNMMERRAEDIAARPIARPRRRVVRFEDGNEEANDIANENLAAPGDNDLDTTTVEGQEDILLSAQAGEDRKLMEELRGNIDHIDVGEFVSLWRRAGGNPDEVLKIMEAEGLGDRLRYWKNAMNSLKQANSMSGGSPSRNESSSNPETSLKGINDAEEELVNTTSDLLDGLSHPPVLSNDGLQFGTTGPETSIEKGKNKAVVEEADFDNVSGPIHSAINEKLDHLQALEAKPAQRTPFFLPDGTELSEASQDNIASSIAPATPKSLLAPEAVARRPRAVSEGQPSREDAPINLGTNYWTFADLPEENRTPSEAPLTITEEDVDQSWKNEQDLRVQNAVNKARREKDIQETYNASTGNHQPSSSQSQQPHAHENSPVSPELKSEGVGLSGPLPNSTHAEHSESDYGSDTSSIVEHGPENNPFHPDGLLPEDVMIRPRQPIAPVRIEPEGLVDRVADWLWGDMDVGMNAVADDEHIVQDLAAEEPFVPVLAANQDPEERLIEHERNFGPIDNNRDREVVAAALAAGIDPNDPDALDDAEDFDGIMELVGMRGPLTGLVQNALFAAVLISLTVALGVWLPYNVGKLSLLLIANPIATIKFPLRLVFKAAAVVQDLTLVLLGAISFCAIKAFAMMNPFFSPTQTTGISGSGVGEIRFANESLRFASAAGERIIDGFINTLAEIPDSEIPAFSAASHEAFNHIKIVLSLILEFVGRIVFSSLIPQGGELHTEQPLVNYSNIWPALMNLGQLAIQWLTRLPALLAKSDTWVISLEAPVRAIPLDHALSYWAPWDRFWAILVGYVAFCFLGAAYIRKGSPFSSSDTGKEWEATIIDILNQAGGVMKVILIISIEMLVFPLYCGLLLDLALLPLFANATVLSRILFTMESPFTSMFVHWFVGTCYMFHFALFVSMCRKIMRRGVLYFIRDPDDPTFHPVRDVLERNVATQLRKITFSAMVYGALVLICLGGVVWSLAFAFSGVLPIHWSSNEPVLEFPIDLLFYNFLMPLAVKFFKPSDGLHAMYSWWFRRCARILRLTSFLFDERMPDEEGHFVGRSWRDVIWRPKIMHVPIKPEEVKATFEKHPEAKLVFVHDGRYVRTPASDLVRIPKDARVFVEVDERNERIDGKPDRDEGLHGRKSDLFKMVYAPPNFRGRIFLFIVMLWLFAAVTGCTITLVPLVFGRRIFAYLIPEHIRKNDIYAFSIGIYILGSASYALMHLREGIAYLHMSLAANAAMPFNTLRRAKNVGIRALRLAYAYTAFALMLPTLFALVIEFYLIVPLHTCFGRDEPHIIYFVQSWTLGLLYVNLLSRFIHWYADTRPGEALRAVIRRGYLDPDIRLATRCFIFPLTVTLLLALLAPLGFAYLAIRSGVLGDISQELVYRFSYPATLGAGMGVWMMKLFGGMVRGWRMRIRDEVYLIGERLHNFGQGAGGKERGRLVDGVVGVRRVGV